MAKIKVYLAGYVAMRLLYNETFSNAAQDLARARELAVEMVERYGMGGGVFGEGHDAAAIIEEALEELEKYLAQHRKVLERIAQELRARETLSSEEIKELIDAVF